MQKLKFYAMTGVSKQDRFAKLLAWQKVGLQVLLILELFEFVLFVALPIVLLRFELFVVALVEVLLAFVLFVV